MVLWLYGSMAMGYGLWAMGYGLWMVIIVREYGVFYYLSVESRE